MSFDSSHAPVASQGLPTYHPVSIGFINGPNPVEPSAVSHGRFTNTHHQLEKSTNEEMLRMLSSSRPTKGPRDTMSDTAKGARHVAPPMPVGSIASFLNDVLDVSAPYAQRRDQEPAIFTLPQLPVRRGVKRQRQRVPPVLQGLHHPPPNAGLLPSINTEDGQPTRKAPSAQSKPKSTSSETETIVVESISPKTSKADGQPSSKRKRWTDEETADLIAGVTRFGIGNWKKILTCSDYSFNHRTAIDLKDR